MKQMFKFFAVLMLCGAGAAAFAQGDKAQGTIRVKQAWSRATVAAVPTGAAYFVVRNTGQEPDRLLSASTPVAEKTELHAHIHEGDVVKMRKLDAIDIAPGATTKLEPSGLHVMLMKLKQPLVKDETFPLTLTFEKAGTVTIRVKVQDIATTTPSHHGHSHDDHKHGDHKHDGHKHGKHDSHRGHNH